MGKNARRRPLVFDDEFYEGQLERTLAAAGAGLCDLGEAVSTARSIGHPTPNRWFDVWFARAEGTCRVAGSAGDRAGARSAYLRAGEYYRQAYFLPAPRPGGRAVARGLRQARRDVPQGRGAARHARRAARDPLRRHDLDRLLVRTGRLRTPPTDRALPVRLRLHRGGGPPVRSRRAGPRVQRRHVRGSRPGWRPLPAEAGVPAGLRGGRDAPGGPADRAFRRGRGRAPARRALFAGYLAPRAAAFEHRVAGLVVDPAQPNMGARVPQGVAGRIAPTSSPCRCAAVPTAGSSSGPGWPLTALRACRTTSRSCAATT
jgi:hypothetical protein